MIIFVISQKNENYSYDINPSEPLKDFDRRC